MTDTVTLGLRQICIYRQEGRRSECDRIRVSSDVLRAFAPIISEEETLSYCQLCKSPAQQPLILCSRCTSPWAEREIGRQMQAILERIRPAEFIAKVKQLIPSIIGSKPLEYQETDLSLSLDQQVRICENSWQIIQKDGVRPTSLMNDVGPLDVFLVAVLSAIVGKRYFRRYLRRRFKFDPIRGQFFKGGRYPSSPKGEMLRSTALLCFIYCKSMFDLCTNILFASHQRWKEPDKGTEFCEAITETLNAMDRFIEYLPLICAQGMSFPSQVIQQEATLSTAGWVKRRTNLEVNRRLAARLSEDGTDPYDKLREELPSNTFQAYHSTDWNTLQELVTRVLYSVEHNGSEPHPEQRVDLDLYQHNLAASMHSNPAHQLEVEDSLNFALQQAGLTEYEETVWLLKGEGYEDKEIAEQLNRPLGGVKQAGLRAKKKLNKIVELNR